MGDPVNAPKRPEPRLFKSESPALAELAQGTSVVIACLLAIPDSIALIPTSPSFIAWACRLTGIWILAAVMWFVGFLAILHGVGLISRGIEVGPVGFRLWRFGRLVKWSEVEAISIEEQQFFSRLFSLRSMAKRLTIFEAKQGPKGSLKLNPHHVPSFFFSPARFDELCKTICEFRFDISPSGFCLFLANDAAKPCYKELFANSYWQRLAISLLIAALMVGWLARKAAVNYVYNSGNKILQHQDLREAKRRYEWAVSIEPTAAHAWYNLAHVEFRLGEWQNAREHWQKALLFKPDYVDAMTGLAHIAIQTDDYKTARELIDSALNIAPLNPYAILNRSECEMHAGRPRKAMEDARMALLQEQGRNDDVRIPATLILAQGKLRLGDVARAERTLATLPLLDLKNLSPQPNLSTRLLVTGEVKLAQGRARQAIPYLMAALHRNQSGEEILLTLAMARSANGERSIAEALIKQAKELRPESPQPHIVAARLHIAAGDNSGASQELDLATGKPSIDPFSLAEIASLYLQIGRSNDALAIARRALGSDPGNLTAAKLLQGSSQVSVNKLHSTPSTGDGTKRPH